ncbi:DUF6607 family protein [Flagellimonas onchidii]|uniref:DUF6607 family protein n=1 Tax=Flagellimonas onchidii TaxID=2562684 RepID=UPI0010A6015C|nr:DUF6607 family protein [Allomuricauda onchidii]
MKHATFFTVLSLILVLGANAQSKKKQDQAAIKGMCGCYEVGFNFAETFQYSEDEDYVPSKAKHSKALEWVQLVEDDKDKIVMQYLLVVGKPDAPRVIKHWRQDWLFENTDLYTYNADNHWTYKSLPKADVKGQWTQKVYQVDDSPRYEGSATWIHADGQSYWENAAEAPLPRREYTKRSDYNLTLRNNRHVVNAEGWVHDQDNKKIIRKAGTTDVVLAEEKGFNTYKKVADSRCKAAQDWWKEYSADWAKVRTKWDNVFAQKQDLKLNKKVDGMPLYAHLFSEDFDNSEENIAKTIDAFILK